MCLSHTLLFVKLFGTCLQSHMFLTYIFIRCELGVARVCSLFHLTGHTNQFYRCTVLSTLHQVLSSAIYVCVTILAETISHTLPFHSHLYLEQCKCRVVHFLQIIRLTTLNPLIPRCILLNMYTQILRLLWVAVPCWGSCQCNVCSCTHLFS